MMSTQYFRWQRNFFWPGWKTWLVKLGLVLSLVLGGWNYSLTQVQAVENCDSIACSRETQSDNDYLECNKRKQACWESNIQSAKNSA
ncbi:MAG TPA: hypothetical protein DEP87_03255, partial [Candidatus Pacebacteria bacterium]|nr:hypothetical protein [Candidatus Paceibacterota bacterium]